MVKKRRLANYMKVYHLKLRPVHKNDVIIILGL